MNDGVELLLERMKTNPEEFYGEYNKWTEVLSKFERFLSEDERARIYEVINKIRRDEFTRVVMQEILREPTPVEIDPDTFTIKTAGRFTRTDLLRQQADETYLKAQIEKNRGIK
jgi:hypothetical protein